MFEVLGAFMALYGFDFLALRRLGGVDGGCVMKCEDLSYCCLGVRAVRAGCCVASAGWGVWMADV